MTEAAVYRLMAWLSPGYPVGAFAYSHGLERLVEDGAVADAETLCGWVRGVLRHGAGRTDAVFLRHALNAAAAGDDAALRDVADLAHATAPGAERALETRAQGAAFLRTTLDAWSAPAVRNAAAVLGESVAYPVAVGVAAAAHGVAARAACTAYLHAMAANLVSAGVRLIPLGQTDGQRTLAALEPDVHAVCAEALAANLDAIGGCTVMGDIASLRHETQYTRLFRS
jgi:urease accessory protein